MVDFYGKLVGKLDPWVGAFKTTITSRSFLAGFVFQLTFRWDLEEVYYIYTLLGCPRKLGSLVSFNGLFQILING